MSERQAIRLLREVGWVVGSSTRGHPRRDEVKQALWALRFYPDERLAQLLPPPVVEVQGPLIENNPAAVVVAPPTEAVELKSE